MSEVITFKELEGGRTFLIEFLDGDNSDFAKANRDRVILKFVPQDRALSYNAMRIHDQHMIIVPKNKKIKEIYFFGDKK
jgi:hypothetical protein